MCELELNLHLKEKDKKLLEISQVDFKEKGTNINKNNAV